MAERDSGPIDRHVLRLLDRKLGGYPLVDSTAYVPDPYEPRQLQALLAKDRLSTFGRIRPCRDPVVRKR